jgi:hypothetical protein
MKTRKLLALLLTLTFVALGTGCTKKEDRILGKWADVDSPESMEFTKDKIILNPPNGMTAVGKWEWLGDDYDRILVTLTAPTGQVVTISLEDIKFSGDTLTVTAPMLRDTSTYKRVEK